MPVRKIKFNEDSNGDYLVAFAEVGSGSSAYLIPTTVLRDEVGNQLKFNADGEINVRVMSSSADRGQSGVNGSVSVGTSNTLILSASSARRSIWLSNTSSSNTVWISVGASASLNSGIMLPPMSTILLDKSPCASVSGVSLASTTVAFTAEMD